MRRIAVGGIRLLCPPLAGVIGNAEGMRLTQRPRWAEGGTLGLWVAAMLRRAYFDSGSITTETSWPTVAKTSTDASETVPLSTSRTTTR